MEVFLEFHWCLFYIIYTVLIHLRLFSAGWNISYLHTQWAIKNVPLNFCQ